MQKNIIALAIAAAFAAPVAAMAEVTTYGSMDGGLRHQTNDAAAQGTTDSMKMGQYNTARWGFKAVDDMGDGLKTNVVLETSLAPGGVGANPDMNSSNTAGYPNTSMNLGNPFGLIFDRQATIGVEGSMVKFDMGWNYSTSFKTMVSYDPLAGKLLGVSGMTGKAMSLRNGGMQVGLNLGDVKVNAEYVMNDAGASRQSEYMAAGRAVGVTYASGAINVGAAYSTQEATRSSMTTGPLNYDNSVTHMTAGAGYNFGDGKVSVGYAKKTTKGPATPATPGDNTEANMWLGASYNLSSAMAVTGAYYNKVTNAGTANLSDTTAKTMVVGLTYALSKKTLVYVEMDKTATSTGAVTPTAAVDTTMSGTAAGLSTVF